MAIEIPLNGAVIGLIGEEGSGVTDILDQAAAKLGPDFCLRYSLDQKDAVARGRAKLEIDAVRRVGSNVFVASHDEQLLKTLCDEVWWIHNRRIQRKGDPSQVLAEFRRHVATRLREIYAGRESSLAPTMRRGDGRARLVSIDTLDNRGQPTMMWRSGEEGIIRVVVKFESAVDDPVVGIMIRTRIGFEVYGTNTELESVRLGPCAAGDQREVTFRFRCELCPGEYTLTAASHDPDGVWHDWMEDAVAFSVSDTRYTAGVANLRAVVTAKPIHNQP
jgi:lipopolysaccharide transport system ATP-binding protein